MPAHSEPSAAINCRSKSVNSPSGEAYPLVMNCVANLPLATLIGLSVVVGGCAGAGVGGSGGSSGHGGRAGSGGPGGSAGAAGQGGEAGSGGPGGSAGAAGQGGKAGSGGPAGSGGRGGSAGIGGAGGPGAAGGAGTGGAGQGGSADAGDADAGSICDQISARYAATLHADKACYGSSPCQLTALSVIGCTCLTTVQVTDGLDDLIAEWAQHGCGATCPAIACAVPQLGHCGDVCY
jgi:hypothetical protein